MILESIVSIILGLVLLFWPTTTTKTFMYVFGAYFLVLGLINIISYIRTQQTSSDLLIGVLKLLVALVIFIFPTEVWGVIGLVMGIAVVLIGILNITRAIDLKRMNIDSWAVVLILNIVVVVAGFLVIFNPFKATLTLAQLIGIVLVGKGVIDLFSCLVFSKNLKG